MNSNVNIKAAYSIPGIIDRDEVDDIRDAVFSFFNIQPEDDDNETRKREIVQARQISMFYAKQLTRSSLARIGYKIGRKDHATVLHACKTVNNLCDTDVKFSKQVKEIGTLVSKFTASGHELYYNAENGRHYNLVHKIPNIHDGICWVVKDARRLENDAVLEASDIVNMRKITKACVEIGKLVPIKKAHYVDSRMVADKYCETWYVYTMEDRVITICFPREIINEYLITEELV